MIASSLELVVFPITAHGILDINGLVFNVGTRVGSRLLDLFEELVDIALSGSIIDVAAVLVGVVGESHGARFDIQWICEKISGITFLERTACCNVAD